MDLRPIVTIVHGSHLYGTSTPSSDQDYKGLHLPSGRSIILQQVENTIDTSVASKDLSGKNLGDAVDRQSHSLAKVCAMMAAGDTVATEILFAPDWAIVDQDDAWPQMRERLRTLLNGDVSGYVSYCQKQAAKYGIKGSRMAALKALVDLLDVHMADNAGAVLSTLDDDLRVLAREHDLITLASSSKGASPQTMLSCCERQVPYGATITVAHRIYSKVWDNYGERSRKAMMNEGIDWKALSHAVRVARQAHELITTGHLTFPRPDAAELLAIKNGEMPYTEVAALLESLLERLESAQSILPMNTPADCIDAIVYEYYRQQI